MLKSLQLRFFVLALVLLACSKPPVPAKLYRSGCYSISDVKITYDEGRQRIGFNGIEVKCLKDDCPGLSSLSWQFGWDVDGDGTLDLTEKTDSQGAPKETPSRAFSAFKPEPIHTYNFEGKTFIVKYQVTLWNAEGEEETLEDTQLSWKLP